MKTMSKGFSLIELLVAVAVVGILAGVAIPSYQESVRKGRRADAQTSLMKVELEQEKYRANNPTYGTLAQLGLGSASADGKYTISLSGISATGYTASAAPTQTDSSCGTLSITVTNGNTTYGSSAGTASKCWGK